MTPHAALRPKVDEFIDKVGPELARAVAGSSEYTPELQRQDIITEAFNLCCAISQSDERPTNNELWAIAHIFGDLRMDPSLAGATPQQLREGTIISSCAGWITQPSTLFDILATADVANQTAGAQVYYAAAMDIAHLMAGLDLVPSRMELEAISAFRTVLLDHIATHGNSSGAIGRPAQPTDPTHAPDSAPTPADVAPAPTKRPIEEVLAELDALIGLEDVKAEVRLIGDLLEVQRLRVEAGLKPIETSLHLVFTGNPGTGKTTVARLLAAIYHSIGALDRGQLVETDRSGLVAGFVGQTAPLVKARFDEAEGGMLFIDEAYTLVRGGENDFGKEAVDSIVKEMEDRRDSTALVVAGYPEEMKQLISANPGLKSRFPQTIHFPDYSTDELIGIFEIIAASKEYSLDPGAREALASVLDSMDRDAGFGNGRVSRNLFEAAVRRHAARVVGLEEKTTEVLSTLVASDILGAQAPAVSETMTRPS